MNNFVVKAMKNGLGEYGVFWGTEGKAVRLAYRRFFKDKIIADKWAEKFRNKMLKK